MSASPRLSRKRAEPRLDPVRWRRPERATLLRLIAVAVLLTVGVAAAWSRPQPCAPPSAASSVSIGAGGEPPGRRPSSPSPPGSAPVVASAGQPATAGPPGNGSADGSPVVSLVEPSAAGFAGGTRRAVPAGRVGVPVRLAEPAALTLVHPGDLVDVFRAEDAGEHMTAVATAAPVLAVTGADDPTAAGLLLALGDVEARKAAAAPGRGFVVVIRSDQ